MELVKRSTKSAREIVLILEDQPLIAMDIEMTVRGLGLSVCFTSCEQAASWLEDHVPSLAILDVQLKDGPCTDIARSLRDRKIPFIVYSGFHTNDVDAIFMCGEWIDKPCDPKLLLHAANNALSSEPEQRRVEIEPRLHGAEGSRRRPKGLSPRGVFEESKASPKADPGKTGGGVSHDRGFAGSVEEDGDKDRAR